MLGGAKHVGGCTNEVGGCAFNKNDRELCARSIFEKSLKLNNLTLKKISQVKLLCVVIDEELSWEPQIN